MCGTASSRGPSEGSNSPRVAALEVFLQPHIWYGSATRIDTEEMDRLLKEADGIEIAHAVAEIEVLRNTMPAFDSPGSRQVVAGISAALRALGRG